MLSSGLAHNKLSSANRLETDEHFPSTVEKCRLTSNTLVSTLDKDELQSMPAYQDHLQLDKTLNGRDTCTDDKADIEFFKPQLCGSRNNYTTLGSFQKPNLDDLNMAINEDSNVRNKIEKMDVNDCFKTNKANKRNCIIL